MVGYGCVRCCAVLLSDRLFRRRCHTRGLYKTSRAEPKILSVSTALSQVLDL